MSYKRGVMFTILGSCSPQVGWELEKEEKLFMLLAVDMETVYLDSLGVFLYPAEDSIPTVALCSSNSA